MIFDIDEQVREAILGCTGVSALVGNRCYPNNGEIDSILPYITYLKISAIPDRSLNAGVLDSGMLRYQIDVWADSRAGANAITNLILKTPTSGGINGFKGSFGTTNPVTVQSCFVDSDIGVNDGQEYGNDDSLKSFYGSQFDLLIRVTG